MIRAGRNIGPTDGWHDHDGSPYPVVFAFGSINAALFAEEHIGSVAAWGPVGGTIVAGESIAGVRSGGAVTADLDAPVIGPVIEHDESIFSQYVMPDIPPSVREALLAEAALAYEEIMAARQELAEAIDDLLAAVAEQHAEAAAELAELRAEIEALNAAAEQNAHQALHNDRTAAAAEFARQRQAAAAALTVLREALERAKAQVLQDMAARQQDSDRIVAEAAADSNSRT